MLDESRPMRCYRLNIYPYRAHTVVMFSRTDWHGRTECDRREHTWDLPIPAVELQEIGADYALELLLRSLLDKIDPPDGDPWAEPSGSPEGDDRGDQLPLPNLFLTP